MRKGSVLTVITELPHLNLPTNLFSKSVQNYHIQSNKMGLKNIIILSHFLLVQET